MTGFDLFGIYILNMLSLNVALLGVHFDLTLWCLCYKVLSFWVPLYWQCLFSLARWYGTWLGFALCKLAGLNGVVAVYVAFSVTALIQTMLYGW